MYYVYIIQSINFPEQVYVGCTENLTSRLAKHNTGSTFHTTKYMPWKIVAYTAFVDRTKAYNFEKFLKTGSGREFRQKRFL